MPETNSEKIDLLSKLSSKEYRRFNETVLIPKLKQIEDGRQKLLSQGSALKIISFLAYFIIIVLALLAFYFDAQKTNFGTIMFAVFFLSGYAAQLCFKSLETAHKRKIQLYSRDAKETVLKTLPAFFDMFTYYPKEGNKDKYTEINKYITSTKIFSGGLCDDYFVCRYRGLEINICDTYCGDGKNRTYAQFISFKPIKNYSGTTILYGKILRGPEISLMFLGYEKDHLEDPKFNKAFTLWTTDRVESRYVLTTSFMEKLYNHQNKKKHNIFAAFEKDRVDFLINSNRDWFEFPISRSALDPTICRQFIIDLASILDMIDELEFHKNIGL